MPTISPELASRVAGRHGVVTTAELLTDGFTPNAVKRLVSVGAIVRCHNGVYRLATAPDTFGSRCAAACAADSSVLIGGVAGARVWRWPHVPAVELPIVVVAHQRSPIRSGVVLRRTNVLDREDVVRRDDGIRVTSPPRTWFDCAVDLDDERFERLTEWVIDRHVGVDVLWRTQRRLAASGRPGLARVTRVLGSRPPARRPAGSGLELRVLRALERQGVTGIVRQHPIVLGGGLVIHPDGALPDIRWALEVDHVTWHGGRIDAQRDKARDRRARRIGWQIDRVTDAELADNFDAVIAELAEIVDERRRLLELS